MEIPRDWKEAKRNHMWKEALEEVATLEKKRN